MSKPEEVKLIKFLKEEKWIEEKATELYNYLYYETFNLDQVKDFIRSLIKELDGQIIGGKNEA